MEKALSLKFASQEVICHELLCNAWKIEEKERAINFLQEIQNNTEEALAIANDELEVVKNHLGVQGINITKEDLSFY